MPIKWKKFVQLAAVFLIVQCVALYLQSQDDTFSKNTRKGSTVVRNTVSGTGRPLSPGTVTGETEHSTLSMRSHKSEENNMTAIESPLKSVSGKPIATNRTEHYLVNMERGTFVKQDINSFVTKKPAGNNTFNNTATPSRGRKKGSFKRLQGDVTNVKLVTNRPDQSPTPGLPHLEAPNQAQDPGRNLRIIDNYVQGDYRGKKMTDLQNNTEQMLVMKPIKPLGTSDKITQLLINGKSGKSGPKGLWTVAPFPVNAPPEVVEITKVVLLTFWRGGSTFLGEVFEENDDVFYWFEPLIAPITKLYQTTDLAEDVYVNDHDRLRHLDAPTIDSLNAVIHNILDCKLELVGIDILEHSFVTKQESSRKFKPYQACFHREHQKHLPQTAIANCLPLLSNACKLSNIRVVKVIRMNMYHAIRLQTTDPSVKVVFYTRDPRGALHSRVSIEKGKYFNMMNNARGLCYRMREDIELYRQQQQNNSNQIIHVRYEDLAMAPKTVSSRIYNFLGYQLPSNVSKWIDKNTNSKVNNGPYGTSRINSTDTAFSWKRELKPDILISINLYCAGVIKMLRYNFL